MILRLQPLRLNPMPMRPQGPTATSPRFASANGEIPQNRVDYYFRRMGEEARAVDNAVRELGRTLRTSGYQNPDREILRLMGAMIRYSPPQCDERKHQLTRFLKDLSPDIETSEIDGFPSAFGHYINVNPGEPEIAGRREIDKGFAQIAGKIMGSHPQPDSRIMRAMVILSNEIQDEHFRERIIDNFLKLGTPKDVGIEALLSAATLSTDGQKLDKLRLFGDAYSAVYMKDSDYRIAAVGLMGSFNNRSLVAPMLNAAQTDPSSQVRIAAERAMRGRS